MITADDAVERPLRSTEPLLTDWNLPTQQHMRYPSRQHTTTRRCLSHARCRTWSPSTRALFPTAGRDIAALSSLAILAASLLRYAKDVHTPGSPPSLSDAGRARPLDDDAPVGFGPLKVKDPCVVNTRVAAPGVWPLAWPLFAPPCRLPRRRVECIDGDAP